LFAASLLFLISRIGWGHSKEYKLPLEDYETSRQYTRRPQYELILTRQAREELLLEWGSNFHEIIDAIRTNVRVKNQRRRTVNCNYDRWEEVMEKAKDKIKRTLLLQKTPPKQQQTPTQFTALGCQQRVLNPHSQPQFSVNPNPQRELHNMHLRPPAMSRQPIIPETNLKQPPPTTPVSALKNARCPVPLKSPPPPPKPNTTASSEAKESATNETQNVMDNNQEEYRNPVRLPPPIPPFTLAEESDAFRRRPAPLIGTHVWAENQSVTSDFKLSDVDEMSITTKEFLERAEAEEYYPSHQHQHEIHSYSGFSNDYDNNNHAYPASSNNNHNNPVELNDLRRDHSCWELTGANAGPTIRRKVTPVIIYEDSSLPDEDEGHIMNQFSEEPFAVHPFSGEEDHVYPLDNQAHLQQLYALQQYQQQQYQQLGPEAYQQQGPETYQQRGPEAYQQRGPGCVMQSPPHSNSLISNWQ
jgi:hypothetical protein